MEGYTVTDPHLSNCSQSCTKPGSLAGQQWPRVKQHKCLLTGYSPYNKYHLAVAMEDPLLFSIFTRGCMSWGSF